MRADYKHKKKECVRRMPVPGDVTGLKIKVGFPFYGYTPPVHACTCNCPVKRIPILLSTCDTNTQHIQLKTSKYQRECV